jgi:hypothetical protein
MGDQDAEEENGARYPDERKEGIDEFPGPGFSEGPD